MPEHLSSLDSSLAALLFDVTPDATPASAPDWVPEREPGRTKLAIGALSGGAAESLRAARGVARIAGTPRAGGARMVDTVRRAALAVGDDLLRPAPASPTTCRSGRAGAARRYAGELLRSTYSVQPSPARSVSS